MLGGFSDLTALATTQYPKVRIGDGQPQPRATFDHLLLQARLASGAAMSIEVAGGRPPETPFRFETIGETGILTLQGVAPQVQHPARGGGRGFVSGRLELLVNGVTQAVDEGEVARLPDSAVNVAAIYAALRDDIAHGTSTVTGFPHAVRLARMIEDTTQSSNTGTRRPANDWPVA